jgi:hypothetical protein
MGMMSRAEEQETDTPLFFALNKVSDTYWGIVNRCLVHGFNLPYRIGRSRGLLRQFGPE